MGKLSRKIVQVVSAALYNANIGGFISGNLYKGAAKNVCVPGLNCYSCPGAVAACPLGTLQTALGVFPKAVPLYALGLLILFGGLLGRAVCGFLCPFGLIQELLYKIPAPKIKKNNLTRRLTVLKYIILAVFVIAIPIYLLIRNGVVSPAFCKWICPAGTLEGAIPLLFSNSKMFSGAGIVFILKIATLTAVIIVSVIMFRPFCRFICPLGAIYSFFNKVAVFGVRVDEKKCVNCGLCTKTCLMDVKKINDRECIRCGECKSVCEFGAISSHIIKRRGEKDV